jgi:NTP pyrophosphatase (non-canonical NTP hydrolase)
MDLADLQREIRDLTRGIEHPRVGAALALGEECGEVLRCVLEREYYGKDVGAALEEEVGDVLIALAEICDRYALSLAAAAEGAVRKLREKAPKWRAELGPHLQELRRRMD